MFTPNSPPTYRKGSDPKQYLHSYYAWLARMTDRTEPLHVILRFTLILKMNLISLGDQEDLVLSLHLLAEDYQSGMIDEDNIHTHLKDIELRIHALCPKCKLVSTMLKVEKGEIAYRPVIRNLFSQFEEEPFSQFQAEAIMRDLATSHYSSKSDLEAIFNTWL